MFPYLNVLILGPLSTGVTPAHALGTIVEREPPRVFLRTCALVSKLTAEMLASLHEYALASLHEYALFKC